MKTHYLYVAMMAVVVMLSGCGSMVNKNQYVLEVSPPHTAKGIQLPSAILKVRTFTIDSEFSGRQMVYRIDEFRYAPDYYNEFFIPPAMMITEVTKNWLADTGAVACVVESGTAMTPTYILDGSIVACYADIRDKTTPAAVLELRIFFIKQDKGIETLVWSHKYQVRELMKNTQAQSFAAAMSRSLQSILEKLQLDLAERLR